MHFAKDQNPTLRAAAGGLLRHGAILLGLCLGLGLTPAMAQDRRVDALFNRLLAECRSQPCRVTVRQESLAYSRAAESRAAQYLIEDFDRAIRYACTGKRSGRAAFNALRAIYAKTPPEFAISVAAAYSELLKIENCRKA
jgi:hypothetical protein